MVNINKTTNIFIDSVPADKFVRDARTSEIKYFSEKGFIWGEPLHSELSLDLVKDNIKSDDMLQGALFNSYFLAAVSAVALKPSLIQRIMLVDKIDQSTGVVGFAINILGRWQQVWTDLYLPFYKKSTGDKSSNSFTIKYLGVSSENNELWVSYLEKAYAKVM
jgi:Calpain family cysteine protease